ncbi:hypothetical protein [Streptomyces sp. NRRL S-350]|uniref:hypothetical protein n=1 Tax=Streptomyces sp. NRRL S-350 TaxID=1463902 RepID=UPI0004BE9965|nr:hypothetical protein [Streptomyces sp. NRRL S-350]
MNVSYAWSPITKSEKQPDGTLLVYGPAATSALDRDNQRLDQDWLDRAMPAWMSEGGNVREQHDSKRAVGVGVGLSKGIDGKHLLTAHIVDPIAVTKVESKVLKGFSVGIKNPRVEFGHPDAPNGLVTDGEIIEVSVVDRPANPECGIQVAKADDTGSLAAVPDAALVETPTTPAPEPTGAPEPQPTASTRTDPAPAPVAAAPDPETVLRAAEVIVQARALIKADTAAPAAAEGEDETSDINGAQQAIAIIAALIISEAESLAMGNLNEACDIATLLDAVSALKWFSHREEAEQTGTAMEFADTADLHKNDTATPAAPEPQITKADIAELVKSAVAEATTASEERMKTLEADLVKANGELETLKAQPLPGGPALTRTAAQEDSARSADAQRLIAEANQYLAKADAVSDRDLKDGYRQKANALLDRANV